MNSIFEIIGKAIAAIGGAGVIIIGCSSWISKLWAKWFMEKEKQKYSKEIEKYKHELQKELETTRNLNEEIAYKKRFVFDNEYRYYEELVPELIKAGMKVQGYLATRENFKHSSQSEELKKEYIKKQYDIAFQAVIEFRELLAKYAVFIEQDSYYKLQKYFFECLSVLQKEEDDFNSELQSWDDILTRNIEEQNIVINYVRNKIRK